MRLLSEDLIEILNQRGIYFLFQACRVPRQGLIGLNWITSVDLDLGGALAVEWQVFRSALISSGIQLLQRPDELKWLGGDCSGRITVKNAYEAIEKKKHAYLIGGWRKTLWTWDCPLKIKLFTWLLVENKLLLWDNLQRRGFEGPSYCSLCKKDSESTFHLFVGCPFTSVVWERVKIP
jgi:hypothetical protein